MAHAVLVTQALGTRETALFFLFIFQLALIRLKYVNRNIRIQCALCFIDAC